MDNLNKNLGADFTKKEGAYNIIIVIAALWPFLISLVARIPSPLDILFLFVSPIIGYGIYKRNNIARTIGIIYIIFSIFLSFYIYFFFFTHYKTTNVSIEQFFVSFGFLWSIMVTLISLFVVYFLLFDRNIAKQFTKNKKPLIVVEDVPAVSPQNVTEKIGVKKGKINFLKIILMIFYIILFLVIILFVVGFVHGLIYGR